MPSSLPTIRFNITLDAETAAPYERLRAEFSARNPDVEATPPTLFRFLLRRFVGGAGGSGRVEPAPSSPAAATQVQVQVPPPFEPQVQVQPAPRPEEPALEPPPVRAAPPARSMRVDRSAKARRAKPPAKASKTSTQSKPAPTAPDPRQLKIPGADHAASTGATVERAPAASGKKRGASADDIARIAEYLNAGGSLSPKALADRAGVPGAKTSLHDIKKRDPKAGLSTINAERVLAFIAEQPRAQSAAMARDSQGDTAR